MTFLSRLERRRQILDSRLAQERLKASALAIFLSIAAIGAFLFLTGSNGFVAVGGAVATIAMWLGFGWVLDRLFPEELEKPRL